MTAQLQVRCHQCGDLHQAEPVQAASYSGAAKTERTIYAVVCTVDNLVDYYTAEALA